MTLKSVTISVESVAGENAVATRDVFDNRAIAGNPAR